jgi:kynurenine formamidase
MARPLRIEYAGAFYHITARVNERKSIFISKADYEKFLSSLTENASRYSVIIHCYVLIGIRAIGADVVSADTCFPGMPGHLEHFLPKGILIMESFTNMAPAPATGLFVGLPCKIKGGSGSPMSPILFG